MIHYNILDQTIEGKVHTFKIRFGSDVVPNFFEDREYTFVPTSVQLEEALKPVLSELEKKEDEYKKSKAEDEAKSIREKQALEKIIKTRDENIEKRKQLRKEVNKSLNRDEKEDEEATE